MTRVVVGYSGGPRSAGTVPWLADTYRAEVVALTLDLGQGGELEAVRDGALEAGALRAHVIDAREEFAREYVLPALRADALDEGRFPMASALSRPLIARKLVEIAGIEGAAAVAYGGADVLGGACLGTAARLLNPSLRVIAAASDWPLDDATARRNAQARGATVTAGGGYRADANLWGRSVVAGDAPPSSWPPPPAVYTRTKTPESCPDETALVAIAFERGTPTALNGVAMPLVDLVATLDAIAGSNGVGRLVPSAREICEAPAAVVLHTAHAALRDRLTPGDLDARCRATSAAYAGLIRDGLWFSPARGEMDEFEERIHSGFTGVVRLSLRRGECRLIGTDA